MSKDIRSYFTKPNGNSKAKTDQDVPLIKKRNRIVIESDDEDDEIVSKKKLKEQPTHSKQSKKKPEVIVEVENFFGKKPIQLKKNAATSKKLEERKEVSSSKKEKKSVEKKKNDKKNLSELSFENDDELEASLVQTDDEQFLEQKKQDYLLESKKVEALKEKKISKKEAKESMKTPVKVEKKNKTPKKEVDDKNKTPKKEVDDKNKTPKKEADDKKKTPKKEIDTKIKKIRTPTQNEGKLDSSPLNSEQKRRNAEAYQKYLNRSGPKHPGSKILPKGTPTCLQGLTFVITGVLDSLEREEATELIQKCGGRVTASVSKKTDYVVLGEEPGASKIQKAEQFGTKKINEDQLLDLIRDKSREGETKKNAGAKNSLVEGSPDKTSKYFAKEYSRKRTKKTEDVRDEASTSKKFKEERKDELKVQPKSEPEMILSAEKEVEKLPLEKVGGDVLWVDKYRPKSIKNIIGQMGEKSNLKKLMKWLQNWHKYHSQTGGKKLVKPAPWNQNDDGSYYKAALLSGPPGVGKTTTVHLVCQEFGLDIIEFNASDTRSKRLLQEEISELLSTKSIRGFLQGSEGSFQKHVLVMDEVDGMAGNEDRGGIQELIQLIKNTKVPILAICNDRNHPKIRSLVNYCFDLRFQKPRVEQIKGAMKSICFKENLDVPNEALEELIIASNHDLRQILHHLFLLASGHKALTADDVKRKAQQAKKPLNLGPWDIARKVFTAAEQEKMTLKDKTDLFFHDYSLGPLFVQDTYLRVKPYKAQNSQKKKLELISKAADSLALGDVVEKAIRSQNAWNLLPVQAIFSSVLPGHYMSGHVQGQIQFPVWLGKNSKSNKFERLLQDLHSSLRSIITGTKGSVNLDYLNHLKDAIVKPLVEEQSQGVKKSLEFMLSYHLMKEDLDSILELSAWPGVKDDFSKVDSKVKAALTRALNKEGQMVVTAKKSVKSKENVDNLDLEGNDEDVEEAESDSIDLDPMIKIVKSKPKKEKEEKGKKEATKKETKKKK